MANDRTFVGLELSKYKNKLIDQKEKNNHYLRGLNSNEDNYLYHNLDIINELLDEAILYLNNIDEEVFLRNPFYDDLSIIIKTIDKLIFFFNNFFKISDEGGNFKNKQEIYSLFITIQSNLSNLINHLKGIKNNSIISEKLSKFKNEKEKIDKEVNELKNVYEGWKNRDIHEIFKTNSDSFSKLALKYEIAFYFVVFFVTLYFLGLTIYVPRFDFGIFPIEFPEKIHGNISAEFYIQKISLLVLSTTLAAFLLKRSFMNRRLADEAYRTAKELDALPRYMEGMPDEMKEKIRFDLAYKYFGNGIHHDSYTGAENLMHENIKANTEFMKVMKGVPSTTDETKADKDKNE